MRWFAQVRWLLVAVVLICCAGAIGQADDIDPAFNIFSDAGPEPVNVVADLGPDRQIDPAFNIFSDVPPSSPVPTQPSEIEVEIWVRDQCPNCDAWYRNVKAEAANRRAGNIPATEPRVKWVVRTDTPPKQVTGFPYWRFFISGQMFEATGNTSPAGVIHDYRKWTASFRR